MTDFFENLTSLTNNISDIVFSRYADVVGVNDDDTYDCLDANKVKHAKVVNSTVLTFEVHDKVILGFLDNNEYSAIILGGVGRGLNLSEYAKLSDLEQKADKIHDHDDKYLVVTRDSGWQNVNFLAGYEGDPAQGEVTYRRKGDVVTIKGGWYPLQDYSASNSRVAFATIPEEIAPSGNVYTVQVGASMNKYLLTITPDGTLAWSKYGTTTSLDLSKNTKMVLTVTYII